MAAPTLTQSHQSTVALAGTWKLAAGRAITLQPREPGLLRIAHGSVWATCDGPHAGALNDQGDRVLGAGERMHVRRGQRVVLEAWNRSLPAYFSWDPAPQAAPRRDRAADLAQPAEDLRRAVALGASAAGRLAGALLALGWAWAGRGRPARADWARNAHSSA
jgi:hypothetical protein